MKTPAMILGTWGLSGTRPEKNELPVDYAPIKPNLAADLFDEAWKSGIRQVDTSLIYGDGEGLKRLQDWERTRGKKFEITLKVGRKRIGGQVVSVLKIPLLEMEIEEQMKMFPHAKCILIKDPPPEFHTKKILPIIAFLKRRFPGVTVGVATHFPLECSFIHHVEAPFIFQAELNALNYFSVSDFYRQLNERGITVHGMQPLSYGFLGKRMKTSNPFRKDDWRSRLPAPVQKNLRLFARTFHNEFIPHAKLSSAVKAAAFCLSFDALSSVIIGPKSISQLHDFIEARRIADSPGFRKAWHEYTSQKM